MIACGSLLVSTVTRLSYAADKAADAEACGDKSAYRFWMAVKRDVDAAPPLSDGQRSRLAVLLRPRTSAKPSGEKRRRAAPGAAD